MKVNQKKTSTKEQIENQAENILEVKHLKKYFPIKGGMVGSVVEIGRAHV